MTINQLERAELAAADAYRKVERERNGQRDERLGSAEREIDADLETKFGALISARMETWRAATLAVTEAKESAALAGTGGKWPVGTRLVKWRPKYRGYGYLAKTHPDYGILVVDKRGIYEGVTRGSEYSRTLASYSRPRVGEFIIRLLNASGKPSKLFVKATEYEVGQWKLEGVDPNKRKKAAS